jgi:flagella basal body P-ring formation protein FlgA
MSDKIFKLFLILLAALLMRSDLAGALENPEQKVTEVIKDYILAKHPNWSRNEIRLSYKFAEKTFDGFARLSDDARFRVLEIYPEFKTIGNVVFPLEALSGGNVQKIFLRAKVEVMKDIVAAGRAIKKGQTLAASDFKVEKRDVAMLPDKYFVESASLVGKEAKLTIPMNSTLFEWMVGDPPSIRQGSAVMIVVTAPGVTVKAKGEALEDGYLNEGIKVKRKEVKNVIFGRVVSPDEVEVKL